VPPTPLGSRHLVVLGLMASGKTALATELAHRLDRPLHDSDTDIEAATGRTVRELAATEGPDAMHDREAAQLLDALATTAPAVIAAAASTVERVECRRAMAAALVVWLDVPTDVLAARFASRPHRPDFGRPVAELLAQQRARRGPLFEAVAGVVLRNDGDVAPEVLVEQVLALVGR
jgi:shikimate kinase